MDELKATIIIPTKDKVSRLRLVLKLLENQITDGIEIIIIFDGCNSETLIDIEKYKFQYTPSKIICTKNIGRSAARNLGIKQAKGKIIIFLDDDRVPCEDFIKKHIEGQKDPCILLGERNDVYLTEAEIESLFFFSNRKDFYQQLKNKSKIAMESVLKIHKKLLFQLDGPLGWMSFYTGNVSIPRQNLLEIGCFDENFTGWGHEDLELGYRLSKKGLSFKKDPSILNYHLMHQSNNKEKFRDSCKNIKYMIKKSQPDILANLVLRTMLFKIHLERLFRRC